MTDQRHLLPKSTRRRREPEVVYEVVPNGVVPEDTFKRDVTMKAMDSLPELLKLAQTFVDMKRDQANVQVKSIICGSKGITCRSRRLRSLRWKLRAETLGGPNMREWSSF